MVKIIVSNKWIVIAKMSCTNNTMYSMYIFWMQLSVNYEKMYLQYTEAVNSIHLERCQLFLYRNTPWSVIIDTHKQHTPSVSCLYFLLSLSLSYWRTADSDHFKHTQT